MAESACPPYVLLVPADAPPGSPSELLLRFGVIRYDTSLTSGRIAAKYVQRIAPRVRCAMEMRSIDAIVGMVSAGLGVAIVPQPRRPLLDAHAVRAVRLGKGSPTRQIAVVRRRADADDRNIDAVFRAFAAAYATGGP